MEISTLMCIVYFTLNVILLISLSVYVKKTQSHQSEPFFKAVWGQRKIFSPLLVYFYDTATDIAVVIFYYEMIHDGNDYRVINPMFLFRSSLAVLIWNKVVMLIHTGVGPRTETLCGEYNKDHFDWYDPILVLFHVYIFKTVYLTFKLNKKDEATTTNKTDIESKEESDEAHPPAKEDDSGIELHDTLMTLLYYEAMNESLLQTYIQMTFVMLAGHEPLLNVGSIFVVIMSVMGSLLSVSNKWSFLDEENVVQKAKALKPKKECPNCMAYWYLIRSVWRFSNVCIFPITFLLFMRIYPQMWYVIWSIASYCVFTAVLIWKGVYAKHEQAYFKVIIWMLFGRLENDAIVMNLRYLCLAIPMALNATVIIREDQVNDMYLIFCSIGIVLFVMDIVLYYAMRSNHILTIHNTSEPE
eukprot:168891_1